MEPEEYVDHLDAIREAAKEAGRALGRSFTPSYEARVAFADSHEKAHALLESNALRLGALVIPATVWSKAGAKHPFGDGYRGVADFVPSKLDAGEVREAMRRVPFEVIHQAIDHGTPEQLAARFLSYRAVGLKHVVVQNVTPLADPSKALGSFRALARMIRQLKRT
jgi:phthiodiolone/phenolphthiodiolone dimycocerosates ketoreductase